MRIEVPRRRPALIRLTPLIDVVFILLVFFMLASSFLDWRGFDIDVPTEAAESADDLPPILVVVAPDSGLRVDGEEVAADELAAAVHALQPGQGDDRPVVLRAHGDAPVGTTVTAFDALQAGGVSAISLTEEAR